MSSEHDVADDVLVAEGLRTIGDVSIVLFDRDMRIRSIFGGATLRHGYVPERLVGRLAPDVLPAVAWERLGPLYTRTLTGETLTERIPAADGTVVYETTFQPVRRNGVIIGGTATSRDVTEQAELDRLRGMWQHAFDRTTAGVVVIDPDTHLLVKVNAAFAAMHGGRPEDFEGRHLGTTFAPEERARITAISEQAHATGYASYVADHIRLDGSRFPAETEAIAVRDEEGRLLYRLGYFRDVTERREAEGLQRQWELVFRTVSRGVAWLDPATGRILRVNPACAQMHGGTPEEYEGVPLSAVVAPESRSRLPEVAARLAAQGNAVYDSVHVRSDGTTFPVRTEVFTACDAEGRMLYRLAFLDDLSAIEAREGAERRANTLFETTFDRAPIGLCLVAPDGRFLRVNHALCELLDRTEEELLEGDFQALTHPDDVGEDEAHVRDCLAGERRGYTLEKRYLRPDGSVIQARLAVTLVRDDEGEPAFFISQIVDLTDRKAAEAELAALQARTQAILDHSPVNVSLRDLDGRWLVTNKGLRQRLGRTAEELDAAPARLSAAERRLLAEGHPVESDQTLPDAARGGDARHFWVQEFPVRDADGVPIGLGHVSLDVTERERTRRELLASERRFSAAFHSAPVGKLISRLDGAGTASQIVRCNPAFAEMLGYTPEELVGRSGATLAHPEDRPTRDRIIAEARAGRPARAELRLPHRDGHWVWALVAPAVITDAEGRTEMVIQALDITERRRFEGQLQHLADHDALTGLVNRRRFADELNREVARVRRDGSEACLLLLDLDGFKYVNDVFGHSAGDELLRRITRALQGAVRPIDVAGRIGGDEFAVLLPNTDADGGRAVAMGLVRAVRDHGRLLRGGHTAEVTVSVGLTTLAGAGCLDGEELLVEADIAMYQAKDAGKDQVVRYDRAGRHREQLTRRTDWVGRLRLAIREERFELHAQPIVALDGTRGDGESLELLLRLRDGDRLVAPGTFLYHAERDGLITEIDRWVLARAVAELANAARSGRELRLSVNLSGRTIQEPGLAGYVAGLLERDPIPARSLTVEITETAAITNLARAAELARQLRALGCRVALDDFGAGFASFYYLKHLIFDVLKIDGEFIERLPSSPTDQLIVRAVVDVAEGLGAEVVAERVTDRRTVEMLRGFGVRYGQGYLLGRPAPLA